MTYIAITTIALFVAVVWIGDRWYADTSHDDDAEVRRRVRREIRCIERERSHYIVHDSNAAWERFKERDR